MSTTHNAYSQYTSAPFSESSNTTDSANLSMNGESYASQVTVMDGYFLTLVTNNSYL